MNPFAPLAAGQLAVPVAIRRFTFHNRSSQTITWVSASLHGDIRDGLDPAGPLSPGSSSVIELTWWFGRSPADNAKTLNWAAADNSRVATQLVIDPRSGVQHWGEVQADPSSGLAMQLCGTELYFFDAGDASPPLDKIVR